MTTTLEKDLTARRLFFDLLHAGRDLKSRNIEGFTRQVLLLGIRETFIKHYEDFRISDNMRDFWKHLNSGYER